MWSSKQAQAVYSAIRENANVPNIKEDLPEELEDISLWRDEDEPLVNFYPYEIEGKEYFCLSGDTFGIWSMIKKEFGWEWKREIGGNDSHNAGIILKSELDKNSFIKFCEKWGFVVNVCDEVDDDESDE